MALSVSSNVTSGSLLKSVDKMAKNQRRGGTDAAASAPERSVNGAVTMIVSCCSFKATVCCSIPSASVNKRVRRMALVDAI